MIRVICKVITLIAANCCRQEVWNATCDVINYPSLAAFQCQAALKRSYVFHVHLSSSMWPHNSYAAAHFDSAKLPQSCLYHVNLLLQFQPS